MAYLSTRKAHRAALTAIVAAGGLLLLLFAAAAAATSLNNVCDYDAPAAATMTQTRQDGQIFPPKFRCIYTSSDGTTIIDERDQQVRVRVVGVAAFGVAIVIAGVLLVRLASRKPEAGATAPGSGRTAGPRSR